MTAQMTVHQTAIVSNGAKIDPSAEIGPYAVIGPNVTIGPRTKIGAHVVIDGITTIGADCKIYAGTSIGLEPQDLKYNGEPTGVIIGDRVHTREYVTIHRATKEGFTVIGDDCYLMNYTHIAHNCQLGAGVIMANNTCLAGHVTIGDNTVFSGYCIVHQWSKVGRGVMVGGMSGSRVDLPPFTICDGRPVSVRGINVIGLRRNKIGPETRKAIKAAYTLIYRSGLNITQAIEKICADGEPVAEVKEIIEFFQTSKRGVAVSYERAPDQSVMEDVPCEEF